MTRSYGTLVMKSLLTPFERGYSRGYQTAVADSKAKRAEWARFNAVNAAGRRKARVFRVLGFLLAGVVAYPVAIFIGVFVNPEIGGALWIAGTVIGIPLAIKGDSLSKKHPPYVDREILTDFYKSHGFHTDDPV